MNVLLIQPFPMKEADWRDFVIVFPLMFLQSIPRIATLSIFFAYLKGNGFYLMAVWIFLILVMIYRFYKIDVQKVFLGAISSLFGPCIVLDDFTRFYLFVCVISSSLYMSLLVSLNCLVFFKIGIIADKNTIFEMGTPWQNMTASNNGTSFDTFFQTHPLANTTWGILILWICSIASAYLLHLYIDRIYRLIFSNWIHSCFNIICRVNFFEPIWNPEHSVWLPFVLEFLKCPSDFLRIDKEARRCMAGTSLLEFSVSADQFNLTRVCVYLFISNIN